MYTENLGKNLLLIKELKKERDDLKKENDELKKEKKDLKKEVKESLPPHTIC